MHAFAQHIYIYIERERDLTLASKICIGHCKSCLPRYTMNPIVFLNWDRSLKRNGPCWHFGPPALVGYVCMHTYQILSATLQSVRAWNVNRMCNQKKAWWCWFGRPRTHHGQVVIPSLLATSSQINAGDCPSIMAGRMDAGDIPASSPCRLAPCCPATRGISMAVFWTFPTRSGLCQSRVRLRVFEDSSISHHQGLARPPSSRKSWREGEPRTTVCWLACHIVTYLEYIYIYLIYVFIYWLIDWWLIYYNYMHALLPTHSIARYLEWLKILNKLLY